MSPRPTSPGNGEIEARLWRQVRTASGREPLVQLQKVVGLNPLFSLVCLPLKRIQGKVQFIENERVATRYISDFASRHLFADTLTITKNRFTLQFFINFPPKVNQLKPCSYRISAPA
jgi:hypothetical protein